MPLLKLPMPISEVIGCEKRDGEGGKTMIKKYYLNDEGFAFNEKYFDTREDAENYAKENQDYLDEENEVIEFEGLFFAIYDSRNGVSKYEASGFTWEGVEDEKRKGLRALFKHLGVRFFWGEFKALSYGSLTEFDVFDAHFDKTEYLGDVINI